MHFKSRHPHYEHLRKKWLQKHKNASEKLLANHQKSLRRLALGGLGGLVLLTTPGMSAAAPTQLNTAAGNFIGRQEDAGFRLLESLEGLVPEEVRRLESREEEVITRALSESLQTQVTAEVDGIRLNRNYGLIGGEQHLYRYPGDNLYRHFDNAADWAMYGRAGMAPGLGAWGYFAPSGSSFTEEDKQRERYYLAIQTFLAPGFAENVNKYRDFFKYRKMLVVNPKSGQSVVAVIGDAGPAEWTGKHLGGSPEVMQALGLAGGPRKGAVLYFFIDDPQNSIPLGPVRSL